MRERLTTEDADTITPQTIVNIRPVVAALKEFFGSSQLSQFMDQTNSLAGLTPPPPAERAGRRRSDARAGADRGPRRAPDPLRPHVPDRDPGGSEHRPDRLAVVLRGDLRARLRHDPLPGRQGRQGDRRDRPDRRHAGGGADHRPGEHAGRRQGQAGRRRDPVPHSGRSVRDRRAERGRPDRRLAGADLVGRDGDDPVPRARRRQPGADGLEHAGPGGAAARDRRAAGRHRDGAPRGDRHRRRRDRARARAASPTSTPSRSWSTARRRPGGVRAAEVHALQPGNADPPEADRRRRHRGQDGRRARRRVGDRHGRDGARQEPAGRLHVLGGLQLRGRDHPLQAPGRRTTSSPRSTSRSTRSTRGRPSSATRRSPATSRTARRSRCATSTTAASSGSAPRSLGRPAGRQGHAEGRDRADSRGEADPRDLQGEGARGPRHLAEGAAR